MKEENDESIMINDDDYIPKEWKLKLGLPDNMKEREVDLFKVRQMEATSKKRFLEWSGQDVLGE